MFSSKHVIFNLLVVVAMLLAAVGIAPAGARSTSEPKLTRAAQAPFNLPRPPVDAVKEAETLTPEQALSKIDPSLRDTAQQGGSEVVEVYVSVRPGTDLSRYLSNAIARPVVFGGLQYVFGQAPAGALVKIAEMPGVVSVVSSALSDRPLPFDPETKNAPNAAELKARLATLRANALTYPEAEARLHPEVGGQGWFDVLDGHKSSEAWKKGFEGNGVIVGVIDDGIDFGHPDLQGTTARVMDASSPYYGWPMAFSQASTQYFAYDVFLGTNYIATGATSSRWSSTAVTRTGQTLPWDPTKVRFSFQPLSATSAHTYIAPKLSKSGIYHLGSLPEMNLRGVYGERVAVLVVDANTVGVYDTVYVDLDNNYDFTDEKPDTKDSPEVYRDMDGDGYADISGGEIVWISDGANPPPVTDWLWGVSCSTNSATMRGCPFKGDLVLFAGAFAAGYTHGTQCASNIAAQGMVNGGLSAQPFRVGGMVQGGAPKASLMDLGNFYSSFAAEDHYLVAALGYDGVENSGDEVQITSNSYGSFTQMWGGWGYIGRLLTALNMSLGPTTAYIFSAGNEGPGYGPQEGDSGATTIQAGSSTQYGSTNWDSIMSRDQIMYGDVTSFFSHGPNNDGSTGLDVLGNGGRGSGDEGINYYGFNGAESWATWGGTSRSGPVVAGNLALVYQAYKARYGVWPTWDVAKALIKGGATNSASSPFFQGAGVVDADRSTDLAAGIYGVYATPDEWDVGDWQGQQYLNFAKVARPGATYTQTYEVQNPSGYNINVSLTDGYMKLITKTQMAFTTSPENQESSFNFHSPDYLMKLDPALIPADAEVMIVRYVHPYETFDRVYDYTDPPNSSWRFMLYNWTDQNHDGKLWTDANSNGTVNHTDSPAIDNDGFNQVDYAHSEIQQGEYIRVDYEFGGSGIPVIVHDPLNRMADSYFFGFQHRSNDHTVVTTTFQIGVEFYKRADWPWLSVSTNHLTVPANSTASFNAVAAIPANALPGSYEGVIFMNDPGDPYHTSHESALPVVVNVIADLSNNGTVTLGGTPMADSMYQNAWTNGYFNWYGGGWTGAGDWRHYFLDLNSNDVAKKNLLVHSSWTYTPTDFNTWVLGPTQDCASNGVGPCAFWEPGTGQPDPALFGPYTLQPIASSEPFRAGSAYPFHTSTGGPSDWVKAPLTTEGLHEIALHNVLYAGKSLAEQFKADVGTINVDPVMDPDAGVATSGSIDANVYTSTGEIDVNFTPSIGIPDLNATLAGSTSTARTNMVTNVPQTNPQGDLADTVYVPVTVTVPGTSRLLIYIPMPTGIDVDLYVYYDTNHSGVRDTGDAQVGSSGNSAGTDDFVTINNPATGLYFAGLNGYDLGGAANLNVAWYYDITTPSSIPFDPLEVFSGTVSIGQDPITPTLSTYSYTVTADTRAGALNASLTNIDPGADLDLYVTNVPTGTVLASSTTTSTSELIKLTPGAGQYRFPSGTQYRVWVHGKSVPTPPVTPTLQISWDHLNLWLTSAHPDVHVNAINPGETVSVTLHFDKAGWNVGDPDLSARLLADMSVMPNAFDELVTLTRSNPPATELSAFATKSAVSVHGPGQNVFGAPYNVPGHQILIGPSEPVTYTVRFTNTSNTAGTFYVEDYWGENSFTFDQFVGITPTNFGFYNAAGFRIMYLTATLQSGAAFQFTYRNIVTATPTLGTGYLNFVDVYEDGTLVPLFDGFSQGGWLIAHYRGFSTSATTGFPAFTRKLSLPDAVLPGAAFTYRLSMLNPSSIAQPIKITDTLPAGVTYVSSNPPMTYNPVAHTLFLSITVPGHGSIPTNVDIQVSASPTATVGTLYQNTASFYNGLTDALVTTKSASTEVLPSAELDLAKTSNKLIGRVGDTVKYQVVFENTGPQAADNALYVDRVPTYLDVITPTILPAAVTYVTSTHTLEWTGDLAVGQKITVTYDARINATAHPALALINLATVEADNGTGTVYGSALTEVVDFFRIYLPLIHK